MRNAFGYGLPAPLGPTIGSVYFNVLLDRLTNSTGNATELYLEFGHDTTMSERVPVYSSRVSLTLSHFYLSQ